MSAVKMSPTDLLLFIQFNINVLKFPQFFFLLHWEKRNESLVKNHLEMTLGSTLRCLCTIIKRFSLEILIF